MTCEGQILKIDNYLALYSLIGNHYDGAYGKTVALPNLKDASTTIALVTGLNSIPVEVTAGGITQL